MSAEKKNKIIGLFIFASFLILMSGCNPNSPSPNSSPSTSGNVILSSNCGDYGQVCCPGNLCDYGECQGGMCVHCGYFGETCCNGPARSACEYGSFCDRGVCRIEDSYYDDCGHRGYEPCYYGNGPICYSGILDTVNNICGACGDYEQRCCPNTDYECDYGKCINGICKRVKSTNSSQTNYNTNTGSNSNSGYSSNSNSGDSYEDENCGGYNEECCSKIQEAIYGGLETVKWCDNGLECDFGVCVYESEASDGPIFEAYDRYSDNDYYN